MNHDHSDSPLPSSLHQRSYLSDFFLIIVSTSGNTSLYPSHLAFYLIIFSFNFFFIALHWSHKRTTGGFNSFTCNTQMHFVTHTCMLCPPSPPHLNPAHLPLIVYPYISVRPSSSRCTRTFLVSYQWRPMLYYRIHPPSA